MLYDILPPTIFFLSLAGTMVIISRAVIRLRERQLTSEIKSMASGSATSPGKIQFGADTTRLLRPSQKSVQYMGSRLVLLARSLRNVVQYLSKFMRGLVANLKQRLSNRTLLRSTDQANLVEKVMKESIQSNVVVAPAEKMVHRLWRRTDQTLRSGAGRIIRVRTKLQERRELSRKKKLEQARHDAAALPVSNFEKRPISSNNVASTPKKTNSTQIDKPITSKIRTKIVTEDSTKSDNKLESLNGDAEASTLLKPTRSRLFRKSENKKSVLDEAKAAITAKNFEHAENLLVSHIVKHTKDIGAYVLLGQIALRRENWAEALEIFEQVNIWSEDQAGIQVNIGMAAFRSGKYTKALHALQRAHSEDPTNPTILESLLKIAHNMDNQALQQSIKQKLAELKSSQKTAVTKAV